MKRKPCNCADDLSKAKVYKFDNKCAYVFRAKQMTRSFLAKTAYGLVIGNKGDYLCEGHNEYRWVMSKELFNFLCGEDK